VEFSFSRSHAPRGNAILEAPLRPDTVTKFLREAELRAYAFPCGAWERDKFMFEESIVKNDSAVHNRGSADH
jgi:hypothetical protein